jgi:hypothetical protein
MAGLGRCARIPARQFGLSLIPSLNIGSVAVFSDAVKSLVRLLFFIAIVAKGLDQWRRSTNLPKSPFARPDDA